jgi:hypothetical protein
MQGALVPAKRARNELELYSENNGALIMAVCVVCTRSAVYTSTMHIYCTHHILYTSHVHGLGRDMVWSL